MVVLLGWLGHQSPLTLRLLTDPQSLPYTVSRYIIGRQSNEPGIGDSYNRLHVIAIDSGNRSLSAFYRVDYIIVDVDSYIIAVS